MPTGLGSAGHLAGLAFEQRTGAKFNFIGTRGGSDSARMVMQGESEVLILGMLQTIPHVKSGRLKLIAVSSENMGRNDGRRCNSPTSHDSAFCKRWARRR